MGNDVVTDFIRDFPIGLLVQVCGTGILFIMYLTWALYIRPQRRRKKELAEQAANAGPGYATFDASAQDQPLAASPPPQATASPITLDDLKAASDIPDDGESSDDLPDVELPPLDDLLATEEVPPQADPTASPNPVPQKAAQPVYKAIADQPQWIRLNRGDVTQAQEVLTILRDEDDGRLMILLGDKGYRTLGEDAEAKKQFKQIMKELSAVIIKPDEKPMREDQPVVEAEEPELESLSSAEDLKITIDPEPSARLGDLASQSPPKPAPPPPTPSGIMPGDLPSFKLDDNPAQEKKDLFGRKKVEYGPVPELDIAGAIEAYLQYKIQHSPEFHGRNIHVRPSLSGGVRIQVDDQSYDFVDEIEDVPTRTFIKQAIAEWQDRQ